MNVVEVIEIPQVDTYVQSVREQALSPEPMEVGSEYRQEQRENVSNYGRVDCEGCGD
jgi:hypothetical protein